MMTLRKLCEALKISRRAVQGYEKQGLVHATGRNKYGHLLYDEETVARIERISFYQQMGFTRKEIGEIIDAPSDVLKSALEKKISEMELETDKLSELIDRAREVIRDMEKCENN